jgi:UDP-glucuronate decarboxylase
LVYKPLPADDPTQRKPDIALAKRILDWTPRVALDDGLIQAVAYFRDSGGGAP